MHPTRCALSALCVLLLGSGLAVERLPLEDFYREASTSGAKLSPDGKRLAFLREYNDHRSLHIADVDGGKLSRLDLGEATIANNATKEVMSFSWIGNERLLVMTTVWDTFYGAMAVDWNGAGMIPVSGYEDNKVQINSFKPLYHELAYAALNKDCDILMLDRHEGGVGNPNRPDIVRVNTQTGLASLEEKNPGEVADWGLDFDGVARLGILSHGEESGAIYRDGPKDPWRTILPLEKRAGQMQAVGFDRSTGRVLVAALTPQRRWTVFPMNPANGELGEPLLSDPEYDVALNRPGLFDRVALAAVWFSRAKQSLAGIRYYAESVRVKWFDREFAGYQAAIDRMMPDTVNLLVGTSQDDKRVLWLCFSDRDPGAYMLLDATKHKITRLASRAPWIKPARMAQTLLVKYTTRDGLLIHGYLTVPVGHEPKNLPLVMYVHGGPWTRDVWGYEPMVQMLANRGYAVLQVNYRGSPGYGEDLFRSARRQIGRAIQDDIEDGVRWAISAGVADAQHIAIMGGSYGGYSALFGAGRNPELYRCAVSIAGVTDWPAIIDDRKGDSAYRDAYKYWKREIGDPANDAAFLAGISPVNFADKITAPVLIIQGKDDRNVPQDQAKRMIAALDKAGRKPTSLFISNLGHSFGNEKQRKQIFEAVDKFLAANLGPGVQ
ncbi:MAG TPA: alpha/beta fold hydrolase [Lacunisphaera sp.]|jgi:dipeptidyl aminopeptidase/acylaminoacyl peptidase|nr:alpha/beta fold hydrolase [Lacunisphaera sp.]